MEFTERLKELRKSKGLSQSELAKYLGVAKSTISMLEVGSRKHRRESQTLSTLWKFRVKSVTNLQMKKPWKIEIPRLLLAEREGFETQYFLYSLILSYTLLSVIPRG